MLDHLVRIGVLGQIGKFRAVDSAQFPRGARVICRTSRGLEMGQVLNVVQKAQHAAPQTGTILRPATPEDHLLWARIERNRLAAQADCQRMLEKSSIPAALMDVEMMFDGASIYFYFLGEITAELESLTSELATVYEAKIQLQEFADAMIEGCGPDCGTADGAGCGSTGCSTCAVVSACQTQGT